MFKPSVKNRMSLLVMMKEIRIHSDDDLTKWAFALNEKSKAEHVEILDYTFRTGVRMPFSQGLKGDIAFLKEAGLVAVSPDGAYVLEASGRDLVERVLQTEESDFAHEWLESAIREIIHDGGIAETFASMCRERGVQILSEVEWIRLMNRIERVQKRKELGGKMLRGVLYAGVLSACIAAVIFLANKSGSLDSTVNQPPVAVNAHYENNSQPPVDSGIPKDDGSTDVMVVTNGLIPFWFTPSN